MLITEKKELKRFSSGCRLWQGIPSVEVTEKGRIFITFYSGGVKEEIGNYAMVIVSDDGKTFSEPVCATYLEDHRCYDPCLWLDPLGRLWFTWSVCPEDALWGSICEDPDAETLTWSQPFFIGNDVMMNKPIVLTTGEWLFPLAVWAEGIRSLPPQFDSKTPEKGSFVYKTSDCGQTFCKLGGADVERRHFDEHMVVELRDSRLMMLVRTFYGIGVSYSSDRGRTWSKGQNSGLGGPSSRFHITRLQSGRLLLINHHNTKKRSDLTALLSEDDGATWPYALLLDERRNVSYPDATETADGSIYITYDRERGAFKKSLEESQACAREILLAKITEEDILQGRLTSQGSYLKKIVSKLGDYWGEDPNPYHEHCRLPASELARLLLQNYAGEDILAAMFDACPLPCFAAKDPAALDAAIDRFAAGGYGDEALLTQIITATREAGERDAAIHPIVLRTKEWVLAHLSEELHLQDMADALGISRFYLCHLFRQECGITILEYRNELRLTEAKRRLISTGNPIVRIAGDCGFGSESYFGKLFLKSEGVTPSAYRKLHRIK